MRISDWSSDVCSSELARKVEITFASLTDQIRARTAHRTHSTPGVYGHQRRDRHGRHLSVKSKEATPDGPPLVGPLLYCRGWSRVNTGVLPFPFVLRSH